MERKTNKIWSWLIRLFKLHTWQYSDSFNRTCSVCGKVETERCYDDDDFFLNGVHCYWITTNEGDAQKHAEKEGM